MKTFLIKIVFHIHTNSELPRTEFDQQLRLVKANDEPEALAKARIIGRQEEETLVNADGKLVTWKFIGLTDLICLDNLVDGDTLCAHTHETDDAARYIDLVEERTKAIEGELEMQV